MASTNTQKINIRGDPEERYKSRLITFKKDQDIIAENKKLILDFLHDAEIGKTNKTRAKKKVGDKRLTKYIYMLTRLSEWFNKPFNSITIKDMEKIIHNLEKGVYKKRRVRPIWKDGDIIEVRKIDTKEPFAKETMLDFKRMIKKFFRWAFKDNIQKYEDLTSWIEIFGELTEIPALSREEVEKLATACDVKWKSMIMFLFDSGTRIEEFLNIHIGDLSKKTAENTSTECYFVRIKISKTKPRTISLPLCLESLSGWLAIHPDKNNPEAQLFPLTYAAIAKYLKRIGKEVLKKNLYPHLFRHSSATYYCNKLNQYQLCYRYGWSMSSKQPQRYIDREGIHEEETVKRYSEDEIENLKRENKKLKEEVIGINEQLGKLAEYIPILRTIESSRKIIHILNKEMKNGKS
jgi:integrase